MCPKPARGGAPRTTGRVETEVKYIQTKPSSCCLKHHYSSVHWAILLRAPPAGLEYFCCRGCFLQHFFFFICTRFVHDLVCEFAYKICSCFRQLKHIITFGPRDPPYVSLSISKPYCDILHNNSTATDDGTSTQIAWCKGFAQGHFESVSLQTVCQWAGGLNVGPRLVLLWLHFKAWSWRSALTSVFPIRLHLPWGS